MVDSEHYIHRAEAADRMAAEALSEDMREQFRSIAAQWRELAARAADRETGWSRSAPKKP